MNELAARPHNSGHVTLRATTRSQFEMHIAAICNLPLVAVETLRPAVMTNLLGDLWKDGELGCVGELFPGGRTWVAAFVWEVAATGEEDGAHDSYGADGGGGAFGGEWGVWKIEWEGVGSGV